MPNSESAGSLNSGPKVFLSYAHDDEAHKAVVRALAEFLTSRGITVEFDMWHTGSRQDWYAWALQAIQSAEFVIVVASPNYKLVGDGKALSDQSRGAGGSRGAA